MDPGFIVIAGVGMMALERLFFRGLETLLVFLLAGMVVMVFGNVMMRWFADSGLTSRRR